jgi:alkanesulfonate monooxygenase SsuD/methylene tetrahydromethanopterin reductase-like flavin-dependent oxidoreductase (luciferase family)
VFGANLSGGVGGITMVDGPPFMGGWQEARDIAVAADRAGIEALVPIARWKGYGSPSKFWDRSLETFTWGAGLAEATERIHIFTTCHVPVINPVMAAKMGATIDHISGGRWGLNLVAGWLGEEFDMFGVELPSHEVRYELAGEWMTVVRRLWTETEPFDFDGNFFHMKGCVSEPKPVQAPYPAVMNAGQSGRGQAFAIEHADMIFINLADQEGTPGNIASIRAQADAKGREIGIWGNVHVILGNTEAEVRAVIQRYVHEAGDRVGASRYAASMLGADTRSQDVYRSDENLMVNLMTTGGNLALHGTPEQVVARMEALSEAGIDGLSLTWPDYEEGLVQYAEQLEPLLIDAGLRVREEPATWGGAD